MKRLLFALLLATAVCSLPASSQLQTPYLGEIKIFTGNFAPRGWAFCGGQLLSIAQNTALFSLLGTTYGGDGVTTFALPDLRGRAPIHTGTGSGSDFVIGQTGGAETVTLTSNQLPMHSHTVGATGFEGSSASPDAGVFARARGGVPVYGTNATTSLSAGSVGASGGSQPHNNLQPYLAVNYIIALQGIFPSRPEPEPRNGRTVNGSDQILGQLMMVPYTFAPAGWADCSGQLLSIAQNTALFSLLGTMYGGNGTTTFALPDLRGRVPVHASSIQQGEMGGEESHTLTAAEMPQHTHMVGCAFSAELAGPADAYPSRTENALMMFGGSSDGQMNAGTLLTAGGSQPHENMKPYVTIRYVIATTGIFPSRN